MDKIVGGYISQKKKQVEPWKAWGGPYWRIPCEWKKRAKAEVDINIQSDAALTFCPDADEETLRILAILKIMKPRSTSGQEAVIEAVIKAWDRWEALQRWQM